MTTLDTFRGLKTCPENVGVMREHDSFFFQIFDDRNGWWSSQSVCETLAVHAVGGSTPPPIAKTL